MNKTNSALTDLTARELLALYDSSREESFAIIAKIRGLPKRKAYNKEHTDLAEAAKQLIEIGHLIKRELFDRAGICSKPSSHRYPAIYPTPEWLVDHIEQQQAA